MVMLRISFLSFFHLFCISDFLYWFNSVHFPRLYLI